MKGIVQYISDQKETEDDFYNEKQRFVTLLENAPFSMTVIDRTGRFTYINPKFQELFGYQLKDIPDGRSWFRKAYPDPQYRHTVVSYWIEDFKDAKPGQNTARIEGLFG